MKLRIISSLGAVSSALAVLTPIACSSETPIPDGTSGAGGAPIGGSVSGAPTAGSPSPGGGGVAGSASPGGTAGTTNAGTTNSGGAGTSGAGTAGTATGGAAMGGSSGGSGGAATGGTSMAGTGGVSGIGGSSIGGDGSGGASAFGRVSQIIQSNCGSACHHGGPGAEHLVNLSNSDPTALYQRLTTPLDTDLCFGKAMVTPGMGAESLLVRVIKSELHEPCVLPRMPAGCPGEKACVSDADIAVIQSWIDSGAKN